MNEFCRQIICLHYLNLLNLWSEKQKIILQIHQIFTVTPMLPLIIKVCPFNSKVLGTIPCCVDNIFSFCYIITFLHIHLYHPSEGFPKRNKRIIVWIFVSMASTTIGLIINDIVTWLEIFKFTESWNFTQLKFYIVT